MMLRAVEYTNLLTVDTSIPKLFTFLSVKQGKKLTQIFVSSLFQDPVPPPR